MDLPAGAVQVVVVVSVFIFLDFVAVGLRIWSRYIQRTPLVFNDWSKLNPLSPLTLLALFITTSSVTNQLIAVFLGGIGYHLDDILAESPEKFVMYLKVSISGQILWAAANTCVKLSILSLYTVLFPGRRFHVVCYGVMLVSAMYLVSVVCGAFVFCAPVRYNWDKSVAGGTCDVARQGVGFEVAGSINLVIDAFIVVLPMPKLLGLHMLLSKKLSLASMFSLGAIICAISLLRVITIANWDLDDVTYSAAGVSVYSVLEPTLGVINVCLPTIRPAIVVLARRAPRRGHSVVGYPTGKESTWHYKSNGSALTSKRTRSQGDVEEVSMAGFDRPDDELLLTARVERGRSEGTIVGKNPGEITIERGWEVKGHRSSAASETEQ